MRHVCALLQCVNSPCFTYRFHQPFTEPSFMPRTRHRFHLRPISRSVLLACSTLSVIAAAPALAQTSNTELQRVEITGSSIKRIAA